MVLPTEMNERSPHLGNPVRATILAGGSGTRLWPLSRKQLPKQFLSLDGENTMLGSTIERLSPFVSSDKILVVTNREYATGEAYQELAPYETLLEPTGRNTAPAIALTAAWLKWKHQEEASIMVVLPADHVIQNLPAFHGALEKAISEAAKGNFVTFGIHPTRPDTGFGYIKTSGSGESPLLKAIQFTEKPDSNTAQQYLQEGNYFWNSGMFVWQVSTLLSAIELHLPEVHQVIEKIVAAWDAGVNHQEAINEFFPQMPNISIDHGILEKIPLSSDNLVVVPCDMSWSDVGSWDAVHEILPKDENNNAKLGNTVEIDCKNTLLYGTKRLIAAVGVNDLCVVETDDAILITKREETQRVREMVDSLEKIQAPEQLHHVTVKRPWGSYTVLEDETGFKMKRITVNPGGCLSLQSHQHRSEHWVVVEGVATVTCDDTVKNLARDQSIHIPKKSKHRLENQGSEPVQIIEVQVGDYLGEDDIERFEDIYGRAA